MPEACFREELYINEIDLVGFLISVVLIIFGTTLFGIGTEQSMTDIGRYIGGSLARKKSVAFLVCMTFFLGVLVTIAEPDLTVLARQIGINYYVIVGTIGVGVGVFLVIGVLRIAYHKNLNMMFIVFYALVFVLVYLINPRFLPICFDSGGVTTGPVTVPFILGFGLGMAASHGGKNSDDSFGLTALCSVGPIISVVIIAAIMNAMGMDLPVGGAYESVTLSPNTSFADIWTSYYASLIGFSRSVALSVVPILIFFIVYELIFIRLPWQTVLRVTLGMGITYLGLVMFLSAVESGFMPIASKLGESLGTNDTFVPLAIGLGVIFGVFGVLAEPAVHVLVEQIEQVSDGAIKKLQVLIILSISIGVAVGLQLVRAYFQFDLMYYLIPGYIAAFALSFVVPKIYTAMAFDSGGVASGPMTSTFILPFCIGFSFARGEDEYLYGFGLVAMVAMMPLIVLQFMGVVSAIKTKHALRKARKRLHEADENQIVHFNFGEEEVAA
ncbi:MAG: DUF1538 domain-containing protein [Bacilli bacterium]|nr:DUF1538 domain-containing protein [Bacilli bacterium]